jgi:hypothetical protein
MKHHEKVFAEFMGLSKGHPDKKETRWKDDWFEQLVIDGNDFECGRRHTHLFFTDDWNWLMAVITKIESLGYQVKLWFLSLPSADIAVSRVAIRVSQGGHNIPEQIIRRRFKAGLHNFHHRYNKIVDAWAFYENSDLQLKLIGWYEK